MEYCSGDDADLNLGRAFGLQAPWQEFWGIRRSGTFVDRQLKREKACVTHGSMGGVLMRGTNVAHCLRQTLTYAIWSDLSKV